MYVIIVGGGRTGMHLAKTLIGEGQTVKVIENRAAILDRLQTELPPGSVVAGDGSSPAVLEEAGIEKAQVLAAVTGNDEDNLVITTLARFEFQVLRTIARVNNPKNAWLFNEEMGVDVALNQTDILAKMVAEEMSLGDMLTLLKLRKGEYSIVEEKVHGQASVAGKALREIQLPPECVFVAILRKGRLIVPHGDTILQPIDEVISLVHTSHTKELADLLGPPGGTN
jgi:trk system potassium uptake protein